MCNVTVLLICFYVPSYFYFRTQHFGWKYIQLTNILGAYHMSDSLARLYGAKKKSLCSTRLYFHTDY